MSTDASVKLTVQTCGLPRDHECDDDGPVVCGGTDEQTGLSWVKEDSPENRKGASWGSVTCSKCGMTAMDRSLWRGDFDF